MNWIHLNEGRIYVIHKWDDALITGQMSPSSLFNPDRYSEDLQHEVCMSGLEYLIPMLWSGVYYGN